ncbi:hypothetical protein Fmac_019120 [Flemingia macrophylla]|uniref:Tyrosine specific protein phosphatases domain-containing protein n=1 Tax=Flemingia macrophylla TaxID=520843 RepID=A0ABD1M6Z0_9FABA
MSTCCGGGDDDPAICPCPLSASRRFSSSSLQKENSSSNPRCSTTHKILPRDRSSSPSDLPHSLSAQEPFRLLFRCCSSTRPLAVVLFRLCFFFCASSILVLLSSSSNCSLLVVSSISLGEWWTRRRMNRSGEGEMEENGVVGEMVAVRDSLLKKKRDFDAFDLRMWLPAVVSKLYKSINSNEGVTYIHCTVGLGRAPAVALAYMFWVLGYKLNEANALLQHYSILLGLNKIDSVHFDFLLNSFQLRRDSTSTSTLSSDDPDLTKDERMIIKEFLEACPDEDH